MARSRNIPMPSSTSKQPWWVKICTEAPAYTYFFGPFDSKTEAVMAQFSYVQDLEDEGAQNIKVEIGQFSPEQLTIYGA